MRISSLFVLLVVAGLLTGCSRGFRVIKPEVDDRQALHQASAFHVKPVEYDFQRPAEWEIPDQEWPTKTREWSDALSREISYAETRPVYVLGPGSEANEGAVIEFVVTDMNLGTYTFFYNQAARIRGQVVITDAATGDVLFRGSVDSIGNLDGDNRYSYEGRVKTAHWPVGEDLAWLIDREIE